MKNYFQKSKYSSKTTLSLIIMGVIPSILLSILLYNQMMDSYNRNLEYEASVNFEKISQSFVLQEENLALLIYEIQNNEMLKNTFSDSLNIGDTLYSYYVYSYKNIQWINSTAPSWIDSIVFHTTNTSVPRNSNVVLIDRAKDYSSLLRETNPYAKPFVVLSQDNYKMYYPFSNTTIIEINISLQNLIEPFTLQTSDEYRWYFCFDDKNIIVNPHGNYLSYDSIGDDKIKFKEDLKFIGVSLIGAKNDENHNIIAPFQNTYIILITLFLLFMLFCGMFISKTLTKRITKAVEIIDLSPQNQYNLELPVENFDELSILFSKMNSLSKEIFDVNEKKLETEILLKNLQITTLQRQISPHFLYNTLESFKMLALINGQVELSVGLTSLGQLLRYYTKIGTGHTMLTNEIKSLEDYCVIQNIIGVKPVELYINLDDDIKYYAVPNLILEPIVENSLKYVKTSEKCVKVVIDSFTKNDDVFLTISDNGTSMNQDEIKKIQNSLANVNSKFDEIHAKHVGLSNIDKRLKIVFGKDYCLNFEISETGGLKTIIRLKNLEA